MMKNAFCVGRVGIGGICDEREMEQAETLVAQGVFHAISMKEGRSLIGGCRFMKEGKTYVYDPKED